MPLTGQTRNAILAQLDAAFAVLEAGGVPGPDFLHQSFEFTLSGQRYIVQMLGGGTAGYPWLDLRIKRMPA